MAVTSVTYTGDNSTVNFTVPFPFISRDHVKVYVNTIELLQPSMWYWVSDSQITFRTAPNTDDAIKIQRVTPGDTRLVNFQNGAVLTEADLDLSATQNFYLAQEIKENLTSLVNDELVRVGTPNGIVTTDPDLIIAGLVDTMLADAAAATLQAAVSDIETNAESIIDIQARTSDIEAYYAVTLSVDGYVTGFAQMNDGTTGTFVILADKFGIVDPNTFNQVITWDGTSQLLSIEGNVQIASGGAFTIGKSSAADTTAGIWLGDDGGTNYDFHIGDSSTFLKWDGSAGTLALKGDLEFTNASGSFVAAGTGFATFPTVTVYYRDYGTHVHLWTNGPFTGTSNGTGMAITNLPSAIWPSWGSYPMMPCEVRDNGSAYIGAVQVSSTLVFLHDSGSGLSPTGFTSSGTKGASLSIIYPK